VMNWYCERTALQTSIIFIKKKGIG